MLRPPSPIRLSIHINRPQASNIHHGVRLAERIGLPLNMMVTVNLSETDCASIDASAAFSRLRLRRFQPWITRNRRHPSEAVAPTYLWVIENSDGYLNLHWLVHVPAGRQTVFRRLVGNWVEADFGGEFCRSAIDIRAVYSAKGAGKYLMKGIDAKFAKFHGINPVPQGQVFGKRSGTSKNIGQAAKERHREAGTYPRARMWPGQEWPQRPSRPSSPGNNAARP